jgi:hypothetical protein
MEKEFNHSFHSFSLFLFSLFIQEFTKRKVLERALQIQVTDTAPLAGLMQVMIYGSSVAMHPMVQTFPLLLSRFLLFQKKEVLKRTLSNRRSQRPLEIRHRGSNLDMGFWV